MKPRVLYITHRVPWPPDRGDRIRTWNILKFLAERADVDLICLADEPVTAETRAALKSVTNRLQLCRIPGSFDTSAAACRWQPAARSQKDCSNLRY